jgi:hypothetical protein
MTAARSLWAAIMGDPKAMARLHLFLTIGWLVFVVPVLLIPGWKTSVALLVFISIYANVAGHWASYQASRVEVKQDQE